MYSDYLNTRLVASFSSIPNCRISAIAFLIQTLVCVQSSLKKSMLVRKRVDRLNSSFSFIQLGKIHIHAHASSSINYFQCEVVY